MNDELIAILDRIVNGQSTDNDIETLRQLLVSGDHEVKVQLAKYNINITDGKDIHIGERTPHKSVVQKGLENVQVGGNLTVNISQNEALNKVIEEARQKKYKSFTWVYSLFLVSVCVLFIIFSLTIPESETSVRFVVSIIGAGCFFVIANRILFNISTLQGINPRIINSEYKNRIFLTLVLATIFGVLLFFLSSSHYLFYIVDNSGSMGKCIDSRDNKCKLTNNPDEFKVKTVTDQLNTKFTNDVLLGSEGVPKVSLPLLPFKFNPAVKVGLIEIGGISTKGECNTSLLVVPELNNKEQLIQGLKKIKANDSGLTAIVKALKKAEDSINLKTSNPLKYAASKNIVLFTDGYEDNCSSNKRFCEAIDELPNDFDIKIKLDVYGINFSESDCREFTKCTKKWEANTCKPISIKQVKEGKLPKLGLLFNTPLILNNLSYASLTLSLICFISICWLLIKYVVDKTYFKIVGLFIIQLTVKSKKLFNHIAKFFGKKYPTSGYVFLIIFIVFVVFLIFR